MPTTRRRRCVNVACFYSTQNVTLVRRNDAITSARDEMICQIWYLVLKLVARKERGIVSEGRDRFLMSKA